MFFALLFLTGNTMMQSVQRADPRIRRTQDARLFRPAACSRSSSREGLVLALTAAALGLAGSPRPRFRCCRTWSACRSLPPARSLGLGFFYAVLLALVTALAAAACG